MPQRPTVRMALKVCRSLDPDQKHQVLTELLQECYAAPVWWLTLEEVALAWGKSTSQASRLIRRDRCIARGSRQNNFRVFRQHVVLRLLNEALLATEWPAWQEIEKAIDKLAAANAPLAFDPGNNRGGFSAWEVEELQGTEEAARNLLTRKKQAMTNSWQRTQHGPHSAALLDEFLGQVIEPLVQTVQNLIRARILVRKFARTPLTLISKALQVITRV